MSDNDSPPNLDEVREQVNKFVRGTGPLIIGAILAESGPMHGYALVQAIKARSEDTLALGEGTVYPLLRIMEAQGLVDSDWETPSTGHTRHARKIFRLTDKGSRAFSQQKDAFSVFADAIARLIRKGDKTNEAT